MLLRSIASLATFCVIFSSASGSLYEVFVPCCHQGVKWSSVSYRCDNYPAPVINVTDTDQAACLAIVEVCCIKQTQMNTCEQGKQMAIDGQVCAIRDADPGAEQFRECCQCCRLGLESRLSRPACQSPGLGEPCDNKYRECCLGEESGMTNFTGSKLKSSTTTSPGGGSEEAGSSSSSSSSSFMTSTSPTPSTNGGGSGEQTSTEPTAVKSTGKCRDGHNCQHRCIDSLGGYKRCQCYSGFRLQVDGISCMDIDECVEGTARCAPSQQCFNTIGRYTCLNTQCLPGTTYDERSGRCVSDRQRCQVGFAFNTVSGRCEDLNECGLGTDSCKTGERCENTVGSYTCRRIHHCGTGYTLDDVSQRCVDNDECLMGTHDCRGGYRCQNLQGSYRCVPKPCNATSRFDHIRGECVPVECPKGFRYNGARRCVDIDECNQTGRPACRRFQRCINTRGSFYCRNIVNCPSGYEATDKDRCEDVDECVRGTHKCGPEQQCINRQGTYFCQCPRGLRHDNLGRCIDVDECSYGASICPSNTKCTNTLGSYGCECVDGLQNGDGGDGDSCQDVDECSQQGICQQSCANVLGTFFCTCDAGYQLRDDKRSCEDIDECTQFGGRGGSVCAGNCINIPGSYKCGCPEGMRLIDDGKSCEDINECSDGTAFCPNSESICINTKGGYKCPVVRCPEGFLKTNSSQQNRALMTQEDDVMCRRLPCRVTDWTCLRNKTMTISWQFLQLPSLEFIQAPVPIVKVQTTGYSRFPNLHLSISSGNEEGYFQTSVMGDKGSLMLIKPMKGPVEKTLTMELENRDRSDSFVISRHVTYVHVIMEGEPSRLG